MNSLDASKRRWILLSPIGVIFIGYLIARASLTALGEWAWLPVAIGYWAMLALLILLGGGLEAIRRWLQPSRGHWIWRLVALVPAALFVPFFISNMSLLNEAWIVLAWVLIALVNPWLEQGYWRGLLVDASEGWPGWLRISYSVLAFALSHPLVLGVIIPMISGLPGFVGTVVTGTLWTLSYWNTRSLRWPVFGHVLADLFSVSILVFLNRAIMPGM